MLQWKDAPPSFADLLKVAILQTKVIVLAFIGGAAIGLLFLAPPTRMLAIFFLGVYCGAILSLVMRLYVAAQLIPLNRSLVDWDRVEELLHKDGRQETNGGDTDPGPRD